MSDGDSILLATPSTRHPAAPGSVNGGAYCPDRALSRLAANRGATSLVIGQLGQSLDGRIATPTGASKYINGRDALAHLHRLRARVDAVVIGVGTAVADDPQLTTRHVPGPSPARIVIDPRGRLPRHLAMLSDGAGEVSVVCAKGTDVPPGVRRIGVERDATGGLDPAAIVTALGARGYRRILIEGGAETLARFMNADAIDELHLMIAPIVLGSGKTGLNLAPIDGLDEAVRPSVHMMRFADGDLLCLCDLDVARAAYPVAAERRRARV